MTPRFQISKTSCWRAHKPLSNSKNVCPQNIVVLIFFHDTELDVKDIKFLFINNFNVYDAKLLVSNKKNIYLIFSK